MEKKIRHRLETFELINLSHFWSEFLIPSKKPYLPDETRRTQQHKLVVVLLNLFVTCYNVIEHDFGAFLSLKLVEDWVQVLFFELPQESVTSLSCKLNILSLPRVILSVSKRLGNKKKTKEIDVLYSQ